MYSQWKCVTLTDHTLFIQLDPANGLENGDGVEGVESEGVKRARVLEVEAVRAAESGDLTGALEILGRAVNEAPEYASVYNNRAQVCSLIYACIVEWSMYYISQIRSVLCYQVA